jgi:hypothetical protein
MLINSTVEVTPDIRIKLVNGKLKTRSASNSQRVLCVRSLQDMVVVEAQIRYAEMSAVPSSLPVIE